MWRINGFRTSERKRQLRRCQICSKPKQANGFTFCDKLLISLLSEIFMLAISVRASLSCRIWVAFANGAVNYLAQMQNHFFGKDAAPLGIDNFVYACADLLILKFNRFFQMSECRRIYC
jgi:hypothetical protein